MNHETTTPRRRADGYQPSPGGLRGAPADASPLKTRPLEMKCIASHQEARLQHLGAQPLSVRSPLMPDYSGVPRTRCSERPLIYTSHPNAQQPHEAGTQESLASFCRQRGGGWQGAALPGPWPTGSVLPPPTRWPVTCLWWWWRGWINQTDGQSYHLQGTNAPFKKNYFLLFSEMESGSDL